MSVPLIGFVQKTKLLVRQLIKLKNHELTLFGKYSKILSFPKICHSNECQNNPFCSEKKSISPARLKLKMVKNRFLQSKLNFRSTECQVTWNLNWLKLVIFFSTRINTNKHVYFFRNLHVKVWQCAKFWKFWLLYFIAMIYDCFFILVSL